MNSFALALRQVRYENIAFWRNPVAAFFVFFFPLIILVLFNLIFGNREVELPGQDGEHVHLLRASHSGDVGDLHLLQQRRHRHVVLAGAGPAQAHSRHASSQLVVPLRQDCALGCSWR